MRELELCMKHFISMSHVRYLSLSEECFNSHPLFFERGVEHYQYHPHIFKYVLKFFLYGLQVM